MTWVMAGILGYVLAQLLVGVVVSFRVKTMDDYLLAGRKLGYWFCSFSVFATWFGAETCIGSAGKVYAGGMSQGNIEPFGYALALIATALVVAVPLWRRGITTIADLLRDRYARSVEALAVLLMAPSATMWAAAQIKAFGGIIAIAGDVHAEFATLIATAVALTYTVSGGLLADAYTDLIQGIAIIVGMMVILVVVIGEHGGPILAWQSLDARRLSLFDTQQPLLATLDNWAIPVFGSMVAPELISRLLAARSPNVARTSCAVAGVVYLLVGLMPIAVGLLAAKLQPNIGEADHVLGHIAEQYLPPVLFVLFSGALVSAILSTVDTALLVAGSLACQNLLFPWLPGLTDRQRVLLTRTGVLTAGVLAYVMARCAGTIPELVTEAGAMGTAGIFVVVMFGLFTNFGRTGAALSAIIIGTGVYYWASFGMSTGLGGGRYMPALGAALAAYVVVGLAERAVTTINARGRV